ncbi:hypothetical protein GA0074695_5351 [Micromonospora viridifaciens]|uniref:DUF4304 domain-containing protein n=1 Tax=Micromonospora viridifaciens TaxID=1881 RepID=A0A1C4ZBD9_MICVI|nr:DUF4304 domain-containing protein [Micromonospora viridifaciens]SCF30234.1 hypothetical protein GA0074695_5351 [Micromonospora viridifaciens]
MAATTNIIDLIVTNHLAPPLEEMGFARKRRVFRRYADNGDAVVVGVQTSSGSRKYLAKFYINIALVPVPWLRCVRESSDPAALQEPHDSEGGLSTRVTSSVNGRWFEDTWVADAIDAHERGRAAADATRHLVAQFIPLLDRAEFLHRLENRAALPGFCPEEAMRAVLYLDAQRFDEARRELDDLARYDPDPSFVTWARAQFPEGEPFRATAAGHGFGHAG